ncbi:PREDICTED: uncharacterized protein LOC105963986 [Erythranthe guttata]|uniref:uncharacterized protein LOC105963986 n=1 Tax=Erythranthe guttata TaxID=4155 RepID=UPI00064D80B5|nr:PREDICTED: uncharacterized protein LOC105963986 [Erythranthe guttata]|eukprot:XP_012843940.1 PREDICTED: uncharacterized protein LOC105963986 [Erythranthe guttata]
MGTKGICILVVNDDITCKNIVSEMLQHCNFQVLHIGGVLDVVNAIWEAKQTLDLVLTNAHKLESNDGSVIVQHIQKKLNLPIILMCSDKKKIAPKGGQQLSFAAYDLKEDEENVETNKTCSPIDEAVKKRINEKDDVSEDETPVAKKPRVVWTIEMHQKFLEAIEFLGYEKAVPKKIVEVMGVPGLTRENVASHLQKFRGGMKRAQETALGSLAVRNEFKSLCDNMQSTSSSSLDYWNTDLIEPNLHRSSYNFSSSRKNYTYRIGVDNLQQQNYRPDKLHLSRNFRIYGDQMRNVLLSVTADGMGNSENRSGVSKFVGYRLASDGNSIDFGQKLERSDNTAEDAVLFKNIISENDDKDSSNMQSTNNDILGHNEPLIFPCEQDFSTNSTAFSEGGIVTEPYHCSSSPLPEILHCFDDFVDQGGIIDDDLLTGTEATCHEFDWSEFDDALFKNDD